MVVICEVCGNGVSNNEEECQVCGKITKNRLKGELKMKTQIGQRTLRIIEAVLDMQNEKGFEKYKETLDDVEFDEYDWNVMVIEELIDAMQYMVKENERLKQRLKEVESPALEFNINSLYPLQSLVNAYDDSQLSLLEYQKKASRTMPNSGDLNKDRSNYALGLCGEAGELGELVKKHVHHGHEMNIPAKRKEIGDVLHYVAGLASLYGLSLEECAQENLDKLLERYPTGFNTNDSIKRRDVK